jgi:hypothetical protein
MISFQERSINLSLIKQLFTSNDVSAWSQCIHVYSR